MNIIRPSFVIEKLPTAVDLQLIERAGRVCYKSEEKITEESFNEDRSCNDCQLA